MTTEAAPIKQNLLDYDIHALEAILAGWGEPQYRAKQIIQWLHKHGVEDIHAMSNLSKALRDKLAANFTIQPLEIALDRVSPDGTRKWLFRLHDGNCIEAVFIPEKTRGTLCVSSQVGCALNCSFCATGKEGFNRNLSLGEIIGQLWMAVRLISPEILNKNHAITNVVMMGMGEPLLNYQPVVQAMDLMMNDHAYGLSKYRVTLSTSGVLPKMRQLQRDSEASLAVSLHASNNALRNELVPINKKYPLEELIPLCRDYFTAKRKVMFEYVMLAGVNDQPRHAKELIRLLNGMPCKVNLIPFNPFSRSNYQSSAPEVIETFQQTLIAAGMNVRVRRTRGNEIDAACGQLAGDIDDRTGRHQRWLRTGRLIPVHDSR